MHLALFSTLITILKRLEEIVLIVRLFSDISAGKVAKCQGLSIVQRLLRRRRRSVFAVPCFHLAKSYRPWLQLRRRLSASKDAAKIVGDIVG